MRGRTAVTEPGLGLPERAGWAIAGRDVIVSNVLRRPRAGTAGVLVLALVASLASALPASATAPTQSAPEFKVTNLTRGGTRGSLSEAVLAARAGDTLQVRGTCFGNTRIGKDLTVVGRASAASGTPTLDGEYDGSVLHIERGTTVVIDNLVIAHGSANGLTWPRQSGGGIWSAGRLTLKDVAIVENSARDSGGGLRLEGPTTLIDTDVSYNVVTENGDGCGIATSSRLTIRNGRVMGNVHLADACTGTGIAAWSGARVTLLGNARVRENDAGTGEGAGIFVYDDASVALRDASTVTANTTTGTGGGILAECSATVTYEGSKGDHVFGNTPNQVVKLLC